MSEARRDILVGLFMVAALGVLGSLMMMFGEAPSWLGGAEYELRIAVKEIGGIDDGTPVYLNGIKIGRVLALDFVDKSAPEKGVEITAKIKNEFSVPMGARAECISPALGLGRGRVDIYATGAGMQAVSPGGTIHGQMVNALQDIIPETMLDSLEKTAVQVGNFAEQLTPVAGDLHELLKRTTIGEVDDPAEAAVKVTANLFTAAQRLDQVLKHVDDVIGDPAVAGGLRKAIQDLIAMCADGRAAVADFRDATATLKVDASRIADKLEESIDTTRARVNEIADAAMPVLDGAARTSTNLAVITNDLREGKGTLGLLLTDPRMYETLVLTMERVIDFVDSGRRLFYRFEKSGRIGLDVNGLPTSLKPPQK